jgi:hypothetical protein
MVTTSIALAARRSTDASLDRSGIRRAPPEGNDEVRSLGRHVAFTEGSPTANCLGSEYS